MRVLFSRRVQSRESAYGSWPVLQRLCGFILPCNPSRGVSLATSCEISNSIAVLTNWAWNRSPRSFTCPVWRYGLGNCRARAVNWRIDSQPLSSCHRPQPQGPGGQQCRPRSLLSLAPPQTKLGRVVRDGCCIRNWPMGCAYKGGRGSRRDRLEPCGFCTPRGI